MCTRLYPARASRQGRRRQSERLELGGAGRRATDARRLGKSAVPYEIAISLHPSPRRLRCGTNSASFNVVLRERGYRLTPERFYVCVTGQTGLASPALGSGRLADRAG